MEIKTRVCIFAPSLSPLRWPLSDEACTSGQLVVASRESQYKVFHFHHGGLDKLADAFQQWKYCAETHLRDQVAGEGVPGVGVGAGAPGDTWLLTPSPCRSSVRGPGLPGTPLSSCAQGPAG